MTEKAELAPNQWDRMKGESIQAYQAFVIYRDGSPDMTLRGVAQKLQKSPQLISKWSSRHRWKERIAAWTDHRDQQLIEQRIKERQTWHELTLATAKRLHQEGLEALLALKAVRKVRIGNEEQVVCALKPLEIVRLLELSQKLTRFVLGDPGDQAPARIEVLISGYDDEKPLPPPEGHA